MTKLYSFLWGMLSLFLFRFVILAYLFLFCLTFQVCQHISVSWYIFISSGWLLTQLINTTYQRRRYHNSERATNNVANKVASVTHTRNKSCSSSLLSLLYLLILSWFVHIILQITHSLFTFTINFE